MENASVLQVLSYGVGLVGVIGGGIGFIRFGDYKATVKLQNDNIKALRDQADIQSKVLAEEKAARLASDKALAALQGKLEAYKEIPLQSIAASLAELAKNNAQILVALQTMHASVGQQPTITLPPNSKAQVSSGPQ